jgi:pyruvate dehydrogenase E1 component alpha subunit
MTAPARETSGRDNAARALHLDLYRMMTRIRAFEEAALYESGRGNVYGPLHACIGQEAIPAGLAPLLRPTDYVTSTHRGHGHALAKGADPQGMMAELFGRAEGICRGKGGSQHIADFSVGMLGANGIVGAGYGIAAGAALRIKQAGRDDVSVVFFGDGAMARGTLHEVANICVLWKLPVLFLCEHNGFAQWVPSSENLCTDALAGLMAGYGMPARQVDGTDALAVHGCAAEFLSDMRAGGGPAFIDARANRFHGHNSMDAQVYRGRDEVTRLRAEADPLALFRTATAAAGVLTAADLDPLDTAAETEMRAAAEAALAGPWPAPDEAWEDILAEVPAHG